MQTVEESWLVYRRLIVAQGLGAGEPPQEITGPGDQAPLQASGQQPEAARRL
jgi:hypothetical protein